MHDVPPDKVLSSLKEFFGYASFRPLQEEIIDTILSRRDVFVLMPTGGGKSLCYQLPALLLDGLTIVVSPLIALMKDQVDALRENGIAASFINSSLDSSEVQQRKAALAKGQTKLLYVAPERLMMPNFLEFISGLPLALFAIDEAHCISEWGHDFRPEYRQLSALRMRFPEAPIAALTATATERVQSDIIKQLHLREAQSFKASFNRPNLFYTVRTKSNAFDQLVTFLETRRNESGIVYCQSRATTESVAEGLQNAGFRALAYHAGLEADERTKRQEQFVHDEAQIICATIAFGMGIDKPNVRYVVHYDLPKNLEGYYQETGRAGRDGLPSDCLLFFSLGDKIKIEHFIEKKENEQERRIAYQQLQHMVAYADGAPCRRKVLLDYFGETPTADNCGMCDNCTSAEPAETFDATIPAQQFMSCVKRSGERFGMNYVIEVLRGAQSEKILSRRHDQLSTYGIGKERSKEEWQWIARQLVRQGYMRQSPDEYNVVKLAEKSREVLFQGEKVFLIKPKKEEKFISADALSQERYDHGLFERLRELRRELAERQGLPAYMIFSDASLRQMAQRFPTDTSAFKNISGVGEKKLAEHGDTFIREISAYCRENKIDPSSFIVRTDTRPVRKAPSPTRKETLLLHRQGLSLEQIAEQRQLASSTIYGHLAELIAEGEDIKLELIIAPERQRKILEAFEKLGSGAFKPVKDMLGDEFSYGELQVMRAVMRRNEK